MATSTVTSKGQITIPAEVRSRLNLATGDRVEFVEIAQGQYAIIPATRSIKELRGCIKWAGAPVSIEEMNETVQSGWADKA